MIADNVDELFEGLASAIKVDGDKLKIIDQSRLRRDIDGAVYSAVFGEGLVKETARWIVWEAGRQMGIVPASIHELYMEAGRGQLPHPFTVPAINVRAMAFNTARAVFRAADKLEVGALIFEIARSEMGYTDQRPAEYVSSIMGSAIKEGFQGPLFIQGDHFQVSAKGFAADPGTEVGAVRDLISESIDAGFYNIDIDTSTLVDLSHDSLDDQQKNNFEICAELTRYVREIEPGSITVSLGGEIGEVGGHNSTVPELWAFMKGYNDSIGDLTGISKISVQTGTSHGGVVLADGSLAQVKVDFDTLGELSRIARDAHGLGGAVQHGASTLPPSAFDKFPEVDTIEIHLATNFQNIIYDNIPQEMVEEAYAYVLANHKQEWKEGKTEDQFLYSTRKKAIGPSKKLWWQTDDELQTRLGQVLQDQFEFLFRKLGVVNTRDFAREITPLIEQKRSRPEKAAVERDLQIASDLAD